MIQGWLVIGTDGEDLSFGLIEVFDTRLVCREFLRSTTGESGREEGEHHGLFAAKVRQLDRLAGAAGQGEVGGRIAHLEVGLARTSSAR